MPAQALRRRVRDAVQHQRNRARGGRSHLGQRNHRDLWSASRRPTSRVPVSDPQGPIRRGEAMTVSISGHEDLAYEIEAPLQSTELTIVVLANLDPPAEGRTERFLLERLR